VVLCYSKKLFSYFFFCKKRRDGNILLWYNSFFMFHFYFLLCVVCYSRFSSDDNNEIELNNKLMRRREKQHSLVFCLYTLKKTSICFCKPRPYYLLQFYCVPITRNHSWESNSYFRNRLLVITRRMFWFEFGIWRMSFFLSFGY
jgi:hypothetical protein